ncbi:MAG: hypothetical protein FJ150_07795 [Euryarchaeota archaeon]|nr:hypothetical protein [Euryarchaeota archaeon]
MKIKIAEIDDTNSFFGGRVLKVNRKFLTPYRVSSSVDYRSKQQIPTAIKIDSYLSEVTSIFTGDEYNKFKTENGPFNNRVRADEQKADLMSYSPLVSYFPQLPKDIKVDKKGMKLILELGLDLDHVNIVSIPAFDPIKSYGEDLKKICEYIRSRGKEPMPLLDMGLNEAEFKSKFNEICSNIETGLINIMGLIYRNWRSNIQNFYHVWNNKDKKILYYCLGVERKYENASAMHFLQSWGIDVYSTRMIRGCGTYKRKLNNVDIFDKETIGILKYKNYFEKHPDGTLNCDCPLCNNAGLDEFVEKYGYNHEGELDASQLQYAGKLHEFFSSSKEFDISREAIKENALTDYFDSKEYLKSYRRNGSLDSVF